MTIGTYNVKAYSSLREILYYWLIMSLALQLWLLWHIDTPYKLYKNKTNSVALGPPTERPPLVDKI
jgi:hypothetical protein